ncbi:MAG: hypothetical protein HKM24_06370, partial [Gammaproteobacteria bacterium]|nr:hypothetical protein [Gammaproteobacteria bacterium]
MNKAIRLICTALAFTAMSAAYASDFNSPAPYLSYDTATVVVNFDGNVANADVAMVDMGMQGITKAVNEAVLRTDFKTAAEVAISSGTAFQVAGITVTVDDGGISAFA